MSSFFIVFLMKTNQHSRRRKGHPLKTLYILESPRIWARRSPIWTGERATWLAHRKLFLDFIQRDCTWLFNADGWRNNFCDAVCSRHQTWRSDRWWKWNWFGRPIPDPLGPWIGIKDQVADPSRPICPCCICLLLQFFNSYRHRLSEYVFYAGLWSLWAVLLIIFEVMTERHSQLLEFHFWTRLIR